MNKKGGATKLGAVLAPINTFADRFGPIRHFMAPMAGITDTVFRRLMREMGAEIVVSELVSAEGLVRGGEKTRELIRYDDSERPVGIQLFGSKIDVMSEAARIIEAEGADFVDVNFGCPVKKVVCDGGGAAWLREPEKMGELLSAMKSRLRIPLSIKVRTGWDEDSRNVAEVVKVAADVGVAWVAIHGRTRAQGYAGAADWDLIREISKNARLPIVGNGDLVTAEEARDKLENGYSHAVMIGRGALKNPWIFLESLGKAPTDKNLLHVIARHFDLAIENKGDRRAFLSLKKFMGWYAAGFPYSSQFRSKIFETHDVDNLRTVAFDFFQSLVNSEKVVERMPFLMGGHG